MRSLTLKLTLAFLVVGLLGAVLVAIVVRQRTHVDFDRFLLDRNQQILVDRITDYYNLNNGWQGIDRLWPLSPEMGGNHRSRPVPFTLVDAEGQVLYPRRRGEQRDELNEREINRAVPIIVDGSAVGRVIFDLPEFERNAVGTAEGIFLQRVTTSIILGALGATAVALVVGILLARTITRPIHELTDATQAIAQGNLGHQVPVHSQDEIGELANSFNRMSADLAQSTQLRRQMTADIAHDLRTPLSVILGYTEALSEGKLPGTAEMYQVMYQEANHLNHLIDDLRTLSLADAGELSLTRQPMDPRALLERVASAHSSQARAQEIEIVVAAPERLPTVEVDPERLAQVLGNLVGNALRHTQGRGRIVLNASAEPDAVTLSVADNGGGIEPSDLPHVFERFYRADQARPTNGESGLGLPIAKSIVEAHGGQIAVESTPGLGTTFTIRLPR